MHERKFRGARLYGALAAVVATTAVTAVAYGDEITNNLDGSVDATLETMSLTAGGSNGSTTLRVVEKNDDGKNGCNLTGSTKLVIRAVSSDPTKASVSSQDIEFTSCGDQKAVAVTPLAAGTANITFTEVSNTTAGTFDLRPAAFTVNVAAAQQAKQDQTITFAQPADRVYGAPDFAPGATASSGLPVSYTSTPASVCSIVADQVRINGAGDCSVTATQAGNDSFNAAADVTRTFAVAKRPITVTADDKTKTYGSDDPELTHRVTDGSLVSGDSISGALSRAAGENAGRYAIGQNTLTAGANYALTFVGGELTITAKELTGSFTAASKVYDGTTAAEITARSVTGKLGDDDVHLDGGSARFATKDAGTGKRVDGSGFSLTGTAKDNYTLASSELTATADITKKGLAVNADDLSRTYGETTPAPSAALAGFVDGENAGNAGLSGAASCDVAGSAGPGVGVYDAAVECGVGTLESTNYSFAAGSKGRLTIDPRPITVTADDKTKTYGSDDPTLTHSVTSGSLVGNDEVSGSLSRAAGENVGEYAITGTLTAGSNYELTFVAGKLTIGKRPITVTADNKSKVFGAADPALTHRVTGGSLVGGDQVGGDLSRVAGEAVGTYPITQGSLTAGPNYDLAFVQGTLTIGAWSPKGFHAPIGESNSFVQGPGTSAPQATSTTVWQTAKGGSTIPLKFNVFAGGTEKTSTADVKSFGSSKLSSCSGTVNDGIEELASAGSTSLRYDTTEGQFIQNWKTSTVSGDTCYRVALALQDGSAIYTFVKLRK